MASDAPSEGRKRNNWKNEEEWVWANKTKTKDEAVISRKAKVKHKTNPIIWSWEDGDESVRVRRRIHGVTETSQLQLPRWRWRISSGQKDGDESSGARKMRTETKSHQSEFVRRQHRRKPTGWGFVFSFCRASMYVHMYVYTHVDTHPQLPTS